SGVLDRGGQGRHDPGAAGHTPLVRPLPGPHDPRRPPVPGHVGLDAALHRDRRRHPLPAALLRTGLHPGARSLSMRAVLTDIEGTTTPLSFVHDVLFPYARRRLDAACASGEARFAEALRQLRTEYDEEKRSGADLPAFGDGAPYAHHLMDRDRTATGPASCAGGSGRTWRTPYNSGRKREFG